MNTGPGEIQKKKMKTTEEEKKKVRYIESKNDEITRNKK